MKIVEMALTDIAPAPYNPRKALKPTDSAYIKIRRSVEEFGLVEPIVWNKRSRRLVGGHQRLKVLTDLGHKTASVSVVDLDEDHEKALNLALNKVGGEWDAPLLKDLLASIDAAAIELAGFDADEIDAMFPTDVVGAEVPAPPKVPKTKTGDLYELGAHRLFCGDSTKSSDATRLMGGAAATLMWTDPPYGVDYVGGTEEALTIQNDGAADTPQLLAAAFKAADAILLPGAAFYIASPSGRHGVPFLAAIEARGWLMHQTLVWIKDQFVLGRSDYQNIYEVIHYGWKKGAKHSWRGGRKLTSVLQHSVELEYLSRDQLLEYARDLRQYVEADAITEPRPKSSREHPTMKPVPLIERMIRNSSRTGDIVLDLFGGSGSTLIACEQTDRRAYLMEIDPGYCDVIVTRWETATGKKAKRVRTAA